MSTLNVDKVDPSTGTALEIGSSGDTITIPSGATIVNSGTATGFGAVLTGSTNNTVTTVTAANAISGEAKLLFDPPKLTIGNASEEDTSLVFDGHAQDYYIGLDDSADDLVVGVGSTVGTTPSFSITQYGVIEIPQRDMFGVTGAYQDNYIGAAGGSGEKLAIAGHTQQIFYTSGVKHMVIDSIGAVTKPLQPAFLAISNAENNVTGNGTVYTMLWAKSEPIDQNADFASGTFTAPVTGTYMFGVNMQMNSMSGLSYSTLKLVTSNREYNRAGGVYVDGSNLVLAQYADMDASDTAYVTIQVGGLGGDTADIGVDSSFYGWLVA